MINELGCSKNDFIKKVFKLCSNYSIKFYFPPAGDASCPNRFKNQNFSESKDIIIQNHQKVVGDLKHFPKL